MIVIVCGVSGTGKSTVGQLLADALNLPFYDADDFHPEANVQKMHSGQPLNDDDRQPWLETLATQLVTWESKQGAVLACSALKQVYRETLSAKCQQKIAWIFLHGSKELLSTRLGARKGHFFKPELLDSQLGTLELPQDAWIVDIQPPPQEIVTRIMQHLKEQ
jgi:6-phosphogluconate dehydrogenase/gluconokinase